MSQLRVHSYAISIEPVSPQYAQEVDLVFNKHQGLVAA